MRPVNKLVQLAAVLSAATVPGVSVAAVDFVGLDEALETNARALVVLANTPCDTPRWRVERLYRRADDELQGALEALGYYTYTLDKKLSFADEGCWAATFTVGLGPPVRIDDVVLSISGDALKSKSVMERLNSGKPEKGSILNHGTYETYKRTLLTRLGNSGFLDAQLVTSAVVVNESLDSATVTIEADSGPRYRFGDLSYTHGVLDDDILAAYSTFETGEYYSARKIADLHEKLQGSGYFDSVSIQSEPDHAARSVPVAITLRPAKRHLFSTGIGYSTDTGVHGKAGYSNRRLNTAGHRFDTELFVSEINSEITANYRLPRAGERLSWVEAYGGYQERNTNTSESDKTTVGLRLIRNRTDRWLETPYLDLTYENYFVADQHDESTLLIPGIIWEATEGRELRRVDSGWRASLDLRGSYKGLISDATFGQAKASAKVIHSLGSSSRLLMRAEGGTTFGADIDDLPATVRFFTGGDTSVRGYDFETIGPVDDNGDVTGGGNLVTFSLEADWLFHGDWAIAGFVDTGSAFNHTDIDLKTGVGIGFRWFSAFGPIRVDFAHPLDDDETSFRLHITLGPDL